jgi:hypothetical protein
MGGAMSVSIRGQVLAVEPLLGNGMGSVLAITNDLAALLALNEIVSTSGRQLRGWAWAVLVLAGGTGASLNTWHAIDSGALPVGWAALVGAGPVVLAGLLSHLVALALAPDQAADIPAARHTAPVAPPHAVADTSRDLPAPTAPGPDEETHDRQPAPTAASTTKPAEVVDSRPGRVLALLPSPTSDAHGGKSERTPVAETVDKEVRVRQVLALMEQGHQLSGTVVARELGCSERTGRRLLRDAEQRQQRRSPGLSEADLTRPPHTSGRSYDGGRDRAGVADA